MTSMIARQASRSAFVSSPASSSRHLHIPRASSIRTVSQPTTVIPCSLQGKNFGNRRYTGGGDLILAGWLVQRRCYATPPPQVVQSDLPAETYHAYSNATMDRLLESLEEILDGLNDPEYEVEYSSGVLTLKLGGKGTYVINKQPPNKQIWLSSPFSGPKRYDYSEAQDDWVYNRDGHMMGDLLNRELSNILGAEISLGVEKISGLEPV